MSTNDRGQRQFSGSQRRASLKPVCQIRDVQGFHVLEPDFGDLLPIFRPRLTVCALEYGGFAAAGNGQPAVRIERPFDFTVWDRAAGRGFSGLHGDFFIGYPFIDRVFMVVMFFSGKRRNAQLERHTENKQQCGEFLEILHHAASFSLTAAMVNTIVAALTFVTASDAETFAL